ncbi:hypothetical protein AVEN_40007-1 [Araneus ventricosus]|uniref:Uncharacterized protein n=1 Tax=Araneus ventricosus TaxID=182803 RepID=A0A4Y2G2B4_ARAVE|nr:hypothetical protein AVEN_40007-1 [Araneus ventricosus]
MNKKGSLVIFTSHFEATRGGFWDGTLNFELLSDAEDDICNGTSFLATPSGGHLIAKDLTYTRLLMRFVFSGTRFQNWNPPAKRPAPYHQITVTLKNWKMTCLFCR